MRRAYTVALTPAGAAGSAAATAHLELRDPGRLEMVRTDFTSQPATTDVTITNQGSARLTLSNQNTDALDDPNVTRQDTAGADIASTTTEQIIWGGVDVAVAQGDPITNGVVVTLIVEH